METQIIEVDEKLAAIIKFTGDEHASQSLYEADTYDADGCEYLVLDDEEANDRACRYIADSLWAFNASFLSSMTELPEEMFLLAQNSCEASNDTFLRAVEVTCGLEDFCEAAIEADGRGHFMSSYDGEEIETVDYFIYRTY